MKKTFIFLMCLILFSIFSCQNDPIVPFKKTIEYQIKYGTGGCRGSYLDPRNSSTPVGFYILDGSTSKTFTVKVYAHDFVAIDIQSLLDTQYVSCKILLKNLFHSSGEVLASSATNPPVTIASASETLP